MKETRVFKATLALLPILIIGIIVLILNQITPKEPEAPKIYLSQDLDQVTILLAKPVSDIYPKRDLDPYYQLFAFNIYDSLFTLKSGRIEPSLASSWKNLDPNSWQITLKKGVKFTNGKELNSRDVKFSIEEAVLNRWPIDNLLYEIDKVEVVDDYTISVRTKTPVPNLIVMLKSLPILAKDAPQIGTGPFKLVSNDKKLEKGKLVEQTLTLEPNLGYFAKKPRVKKLVYKYLEESKRASLTREGVDQTYQLIEAGGLKSDLSSKLLTSNFSKVTFSFPSFNAIFINLDKIQDSNFPGSKNPLASSSIRRALSLALDQRMVINEASISGKVTGQLASSVAFGYDPSLKSSSVSRAEAKKILRENGYEKGFTFTLDLPFSQMEAGESIAKQLKEVGIIAKLRTSNSSEEFAQVSQGEAMAYLGNWLNENYDTTAVFTTGLLHRGGQNYISYTNQKIDNLMDELRDKFDPTEREKILQTAMKVAVEEKSWLPLWEDTTFFLVNDRLDVNPTTSFPLGVDMAGK